MLDAAVLQAARDAAADIGVDPPQHHTTAMVVATLTSVATSLATTSPTSQPSPDNPTDPQDPEGECQLLGSFALFVQAALGALALLSLVYKRWKERPQRPVKIWFFDVSKQVFGSVLVHIANIFMSMLTSGRFSFKIDPTITQRAMIRRDDSNIPNPCSFYLLNLGIDTTLGIPILIILVRLLTYAVSFTPVGSPPESIQSGNYGRPPNAWWWLKQSVIYFCGLMGMKICVLVIFLTMPWISVVGDWALSWTAGNEKLQIAFVMMIFPLIMNGLQYYIIDSFIKKPIHEDDHHDDLNHDATDRRRGRFNQIPSSPDADFDSGDEAEDDSDAPSLNTKIYHSHKLGEDLQREYDPDVDGDVPTIVGSSSSQTKMERTDN